MLKHQWLLKILAHRSGTLWKPYNALTHMPRKLIFKYLDTLPSKQEMFICKLLLGVQIDKNNLDEFMKYVKETSE